MATDVDLSRSRAAARGCSAVLAGVALTVLVLELASRHLAGPDYVRLRQAEYKPFTWFIGVISVLTLASVITLTVQAYKHKRQLLRPPLIALALILVAIVITLAVNGPINLEQLNWNPTTPPANWSEIRDHWQLAHAARTVVLLAAAGYLNLPTGASGG
ncbi:anthrone oxygenase family protein [Kribbella solani]|uniref:DUF1772 domain-containing protein n=1 Tax=Kribbella solani TaxID=236067 RepID=A0A841DLV7_9ACTN|nr:DUF1772 domain-containing protein [Kribbella solani]MBB5977417.1 hypothetical protein [Kribbella solani]